MTRRDMLQGVGLAVTLALSMAGRPVFAADVPGPASAPDTQPAARGPTDQDVQQAIARLQAHLYAKQTADGAWELSGYTSQRGGETALVTLAMLASGQSQQNPPLARAIAFLTSAHMASTYALSLRAQVLANLPDTYLPKLRADLGQLTAIADADGCFSYTIPPVGQDLSNTQYGALGLWAAEKRGLAVDDEIWQHLTRHLMTVQNADGGWGYAPGGPSYHSMTAAGLNLMVAAQQHLDRKLDLPDQQHDRAIERGYDWLDQNFDGAHNSQWTAMEFYYLYSLERVGLAFGVRRLHGQDWFERGTQHVTDLLQQPDPSWIDQSVPETAFALAFLSRGRVPVWITKLRPGEHTRNRPNDLYFLTRYLSDLREGEINWQFVQLDESDGQEWMDAPVAYIASDRPIELNDRQVQLIKQYLDGGGLLLANADIGSESMAESIRRLARQLYPQWPMKRLPPTHEIYRSLFHVERPELEPIEAVSNGDRELILLPFADWGRAWQAEPYPGHSDAWRLAANLLVTATNRGQLPPRLHHRFEARADRPVTGNVSVALLRVGDHPPPEPEAWSGLSPVLFNRTGLNLTTVVTDVEDLPRIAGQIDLVHLQGADAIELTPGQRNILANYAAKGGTVLVETAGGLGGFARAVEDQMSRALNVAVIPIDAENPIISGQSLDGGADRRQVGYRQYSVVRMDVSRWPRLAAIHLNDRPAIIISNEDLSLGMMGLGRWAVNGYSIDSSRDLAINLLLWARKNNHRDTGARR